VSVAAVPDGPERDLAPDLDDFLAEPEEPHDWIVPGLIDRQDRVILTGIEGGSKSTTIRSVASGAACGLHPFTLAPTDPRRVLLYDLENPRTHVREMLRPLREFAADGYRRGNLRVRVKPEGIDLLRQRDRDALMRLVEGADLLAIGPLYKLASGDPTDERTARTVAQALDRARVEHGCALLMEAHSPHAANGSTRVLRPYGASLWVRWPELGLHINKRGQLLHWRGARVERDWPEQLKRGVAWPWIIDDSDTGDAASEWKPTRLMDRASRELERRTQAGDLPSRDALARSVTGKHAYLTRAIDQLVEDGYAERVGRKLRSIKPYREEANR
jgi:replicative DNA helicase